MSWQTCVCDDDYEICDTEPHQIRRKSNKRIIKEWKKDNDYIECKMNGKNYYKHRIIATQFVQNVDPENKVEVDHINHDRTDNRISNLRWVSSSQNNKNRSSWSKRAIEYFDKIPTECPNDIIDVDKYGDHEFEDLYFVDNNFYFDTGINFKRLLINRDTFGHAFVYAFDTNKKRVSICYSKFKRIYGFD